MSEGPSELTVITNGWMNKEISRLLRVKITKVGKQTYESGLRSPACFITHSDTHTHIFTLNTQQEEWLINSEVRYYYYYRFTLHFSSFMFKTHMQSICITSYWRFFKKSLSRDMKVKLQRKKGSAFRGVHRMLVLMWRNLSRTPPSLNNLGANKVKCGTELYCTIVLSLPHAIPLVEPPVAVQTGSSIVW